MNSLLSIGYFRQIINAVAFILILSSGSFSNAQSFTPHPTLAPALSPYPTTSPTAATATILTFDVTVRVTGFTAIARRKLLASPNLRSQVGASDMESLLAEVTLNGYEQQVFVDTMALAQGIDGKFISYKSASTDASDVLVTTTTSLPLTGAFAGMTSAEVYDSLIDSVSEAVSGGSYTTNLQAIATASGVSSLTSASSSTVESFGDASTAVYTTFNDDDSLTVSDGEITAIVILTNVGLVLLSMGGFYGYKAYLRRNLRNNMEDGEAGGEAPMLGDDQNKPAEVSVYHDETYNKTADQMESPRGITVADLAPESPATTPTAAAGEQAEPAPFNSE
jgi:hypothetical protein